jgi:hypothetical protein
MVCEKKKVGSDGAVLNGARNLVDVLLVCS